MPGIGEKIKVYREKAGLSQQALADRVNKLIGTNFKRNTISNYENNVSEPSLEVLSALAKALNLNAGALVEDYLVTFEGASNADLVQNIGRHIITALQDRIKALEYERFEIFKIILESTWTRVRDRKNKDKLVEKLTKEFLSNEIIAQLVILQLLHESEIQDIVSRFIRLKQV